jgi:PST family polysaccharide transporter/lipopolysaccharide exporter
VTDVLTRVRRVLAVSGTTAGRATLTAGSWAVLARLMGGAGRTIRSLILARLLAPADFGVTALALVAIDTLEACTTTGLEAALVQRRDQRPEQVDRVFTIQLIRGIVIGIAIWSLAGGCATAFHEARLESVMRWLAVLPVLRGLSNPGTITLVQNLNFRSLFAWDTAETIAALAAGIGVAFWRADATALVASSLAGQAVRSTLSWWIVPLRARLRYDLHQSAGLFHFGRWVLLANILMVVNVHGEQVVVGALMGAGALGTYQLASRLAELPIVLLAHPALQVCFPALSGITDDRRAFVDLWLALVGAITAASLAWMALVIPLASTVVPLVFGAHWVAAAPILQIAVVTAVVRAVVVVGQPAFYALGRPDLHVHVNVVRLVGIAILLPFGAARFGLAGIAGAVLGGTACAALVQVAIVRRAITGIPPLRA